MSTHETAKARECHLRKRVKEIAWQSTAKGWEWAEKQMLDVLREATQREAAARLEEAKWWRHRMPRIEHGLMEPCRCDQCHRIAELERQASGQAEGGAEQTIPKWFQRLNQKLKLFAQEHGIQFPYDETIEGRVMTILEAISLSGQQGTSATKLDSIVAQVPHSIRLSRGSVNAYGAEVLRDLCNDDCQRCQLEAYAAEEKQRREKLTTAWKALQETTSDCPYCESEWPEHALGDDCPYKVLSALLEEE